MAVKITLALDNKADHDLLVETLQKEADNLRHFGVEDTQVMRRPIAERHLALETLLRQVR